MRQLVTINLLLILIATVASPATSQVAERIVVAGTIVRRSPKLNGHVERAQRTHREEFCEVAELPWTIQALNVELRTWEDVYNTIRPHQRCTISRRRSFSHTGKPTTSERRKCHSRSGVGGSLVIN